MQTPYVYKMVNNQTNEFYIGCRFVDGCDPNESFDIYASSSKLVKKMIRDNPEHWEKFILLTGDIELVQIEEQSIIKQNKDNLLCLNGAAGAYKARMNKSNQPKLKELNTESLKQFMKDLGLKVKMYRKENKITSVALSESAGISRVTLHRIESGNTGVAIDNLISVLFVLGIQYHIFN